MFKNILFDFDGTVCKSHIAIFEGVRATYKALNLTPPPEDALRFFIGPALEIGFSKYGGIKDENLVHKACEIYRDIFENQTFTKCEIFPEFLKTIAKLRNEKDEHGNNKYKLFVTSSRPNRSLIPLSNMLSLDKYFDKVYGSTEGHIENVKKMVINNCLKEQGITNLSETLLLGDRMYDIEGGHDIGIKVCAVLWGYGSLDEFKGYNADYIINEPDEIFNIIK